MAETRRLYEEEIAGDPNANQGLDVLGLPRRGKERFAAIALMFIESGIIAGLSGKACKVLWGLASLTTKRYRNTNAGNEKIAERSGVSEGGVKKALTELEYYHLITRMKKKKGKRNIALNRWDTAEPKLIEEEKIVADRDGKVVFLKPYGVVSKSYLNGVSK